MECALDIMNGCRCIWQRFTVFARTYSGYWYMSWSWSRQEFEQGVSSGILQDMFGVMRSLMGNMEPTRYSVGARTCQLSLYSKTAFKQDTGDDWWKSLDTFLPGLQQCFRNHSTSEICASIWLCKCIKHVHQSGSVSVSNFQQFWSASIRKFSYHGFLQMTAQGTQSNEIWIPSWIFMHACEKVSQFFVALVVELCILHKVGMFGYILCWSRKEEPS
jgi:hypothetical protein